MINGVFIKNGKIAVFHKGRRVTEDDTRRYLHGYERSKPVSAKVSLFYDLFAPSYIAARRYNSANNPRDN